MTATTTGQWGEWRRRCAIDKCDEPTAQAPARKRPDGGPGSGPKGHVRGADYYRE